MTSIWFPRLSVVQDDKHYVVPTERSDEGPGPWCHPEWQRSRSIPEGGGLAPGVIPKRSEGSRFFCSLWAKPNARSLRATPVRDDKHLVPPAFGGLE